MRSGGAAKWNEHDGPRDDTARDEAIVRGNFWRKLRQFAAQLPFAEDLLTAYYCALDRNTPNHVRAVALGALAYFVLPFDVVPDMLPMLGFTDDVAVLAGAIRVIWTQIKPEHRQAANAALERMRGPGGE